MMQSGDISKRTILPGRKSQEAISRRRLRHTKRKVSPFEAISREESVRDDYPMKAYPIGTGIRNEAAPQPKRTSEEKIRSFPDFGLIGYFTFGSAGTILEVNPTGASFLGMDRDTLIHRRFQRFVHPDDIPAFRAFCRKVMTTSATQTCELRLRRDGNFPVYVLMIGRPAGIHPRGRERFCAAAVNITERRQTEEILRKNEEQYRSFLQNLPGIAFRRHHDYAHVFLHGIIEEITGYAPEEFTSGRVRWDEIVHVNDRARIVGHGASPPPARREYRIVHKDGAVRWVQEFVQKIRIDADDRSCIQGVLLDVTERKEADERLREYAVNLERSNADLERYAYVASHDLQEPLRAVMSYTQLLARRYRGNLDPDADEFIDFIVDGAGRMHTLINDLLEFSRVSVCEEDQAAIDSGKALQETLKGIHWLIEESGATISFDPLPTVVADATQLSQVFLNLIGNAIKFRGNEPPRIHISAARIDGYWRFSVRDNGIGIEPQYFDRIFIIFKRLHTRDTYSGTGIGLALCKRIIERHGGEIWVTSEPGMGSTFYFTLPD
jgi:PAS domain S-box-containing protein